jgi:hypothetical protein
VINADAFNEILHQLPHAPRTEKRLRNSARSTSYYEIEPEVRDEVGSALRDRLAAMKSTDLVGIRACMKALRNLYHC